MTDPTQRVHGLAGDRMPADWPALTHAEVAALLRRYDTAGTLQRIGWHSPRPLSAAALIETSAGTLFVKRHHRRVRTVDTLTEEHRFITHLRANGVPIAAVLADTQGQTAVPIGAWVYELHHGADGVDLYREALSWSPMTDRGHARAAGQALATLHDAAADYRAPQRATHLLVARAELLLAPDPIAALHAQLPARPGLADYLRGRDWPQDLARMLAPFHRTVQPRLRQQPALWTHGDWHASNLCWSDAGSDTGVSAVLDFGLAARTFALFDLATAIERNAIAWLALDGGDAAVHADIALALIDGYRQRRPLDASEVALLADLLPLVHLDFALSEVEYFHAITGSREHADVAYDTFLLGHAAWFGTPPGQRLRQTLRQHA